MDRPRRCLLPHILRCASEVQAVFPIYSIHLRHSIPYIPSIRAGSHPRLFWTVGDNTVPDTHCQGTVCQETAPGASNMGQHTRSSLRRCFDFTLLGSSRTSTIVCLQAVLVLFLISLFTNYDDPSSLILSLFISLHFFHRSAFLLHCQFIITRIPIKLHFKQILPASHTPFPSYFFPSCHCVEQFPLPLLIV